MFKNDLFTSFNDFDDYDQYEEPDEDDLAELSEELGYLTIDKLADKADELLNNDEDFSDEINCFDNDNNGFTPISEYFEHTVLPYEKNRKMAEIIEKSSV